MVEPESHPNLAALLFAVFQDVQRELIREVAAAGHPAIRPKHGAVLANVEPGGTRGSVLAQRAGMSQPSMGELVDELEAAGYVERRPDPDDRRAKLVVPTPAAQQAVAAAESAIARVEASYRALLGPERYGELRAALDDLRRAAADDAATRQGAR